MVWIENQARVCHSNSVPSLGASYGRGAATMPQWDLANSDCVLVMGSNMAEAHLLAFRFVLQAQERGATVIPVDQRFTRTTALYEIHATIQIGRAPCRERVCQTVKDSGADGSLKNTIKQTNKHTKR